MHAPLRVALVSALCAAFCACGGGSGAAIVGGSSVPVAAQAAGVASANASDFAGLLDIGNGRRMYIECRGSGSPAVMLVGGYKASAEDWSMTDKPGPTVFAGVAAFTRVCAYDRPGTPVGESPSRSDPVPQPTTAADAANDLRALLDASKPSGVPVLAGHSYGGLVAKLYARSHARDVSGLVLVDALTEGLQDAETPEQWVIQRQLAMGDISQAPEDYPDLERVDIDRSFAQVRAAPPLQPMPLLVLSADHGWGPLFPALIAEGRLPADTPPDFGYVTDAAQAKAQAQLAALVPGAVHITETDSGHEIQKEQPQLVIDSIRRVVDAARQGSSRLRP